eukprot:16844-Eustigmatos_ZCMA.PRE.1
MEGAIAVEVTILWHNQLPYQHELRLRGTLYMMCNVWSSMAASGRMVAAVNIRSECLNVNEILMSSIACD